MTLCPVSTTVGVATVSLRQEQRRRYFFALDQREFLNLSSFESRGKNSSKGGSIIGDCEEERKRSEEFGCREDEQHIHILRP